MTRISVRVLTPSDVEAARQMFTVFQTAFEAESTVPPSQEHLQRLLAKDDFHVLVALHNSAVIGGLTIYELELLNEKREFFIYDLAVEAAYRRQGVASALMKFAQELAVAHGISSLYVPAIADEAEAVRFYESTGLKREDVAWFTRDFN